MHSYRRRHNHYPVVAFLDIKSAYDTVDRRIIWQSMLASSAPLSLVSLLANMFDDVSVLSVSPSGPPGPGALVADGVPFGPLSVVCG
ncbi:hypothetical protein G6F37_014212 [Rhizopus arrhizus]|nr:hypothetical protein G6F37_014212 [Rhizopus arrhizus]